MGVAAIMAAMAILSVSDTLVARIAGDIGLWQFHVLRALMAMALLGLMAALGRVRLRARRTWAVALRGGLTAAAMVLYFGALAFLPVGQVAAGLFSAPLWILLLGRLGFGHGVRLVEVVLALVGFGGVLMVLAPWGEGLGLASLAPLAAGLVYGLAGLATRAWCAEESPAAMLAWFFACLTGFGLIGLVVLALWPLPVPEGADGFILRGWVWPMQAVSWAVLALQAVAAPLSVGLIMRGYQLLPAARASVLEYGFIPLAGLWGWLLWGQVPSLREGLGIAVILAAGALTAAAARPRP